MLRRIKILSFLSLVFSPGIIANAQAQYQVLYSFGANGSNDGSLPKGKLVLDVHGNLYGTTNTGGSTGAGTIFELSPSISGQWTENILYNFCSQPDCSDGASPSAGLIFDQAGNLYGTTVQGGLSGNDCCFGTVFELSPPALPGGSWTEEVLWRFGGGVTGDGAYPDAKLVFDPAGDLYGTASSGGSYGAGAVFELMPIGNGEWNETVLYSFCASGHGSCTDGGGPKAGVTFDKSGNLYGTTYAGGEGHRGAVYELSPNSNGQWTETVLHAFGLNASGPLSAIDLDDSGNLYGTANYGGLGAQECNQSCGGVFKLTKVGGQWKTSLFQFNGLNGGNPAAGIFLISSENTAFGTTLFGGTGGTVFKFHGTKETVLYNFCSQPSCADGSQPGTALISDSSGNLYGTTTEGGAFGKGVVFEITP
jgi:uncharacterized repeat protein (TIGR03803 family)